MTPEMFNAAVETVIRNYHDDKEIMHVKHDELMMEVLSYLGYNEGCDLIEEQTRWYA